MQRRIKPIKLQENFYGTLFPKPAERVIDMSTLDGGLNLWELPYRMDKNQSPDCVNVYWKNGYLRSRPGQAALKSGIMPQVFTACYDRLWQGEVIAVIGSRLVRVSPTTGVETDIGLLLSNLSPGNFFVFNDELYYLGGGDYVKIAADFTMTRITGYVPTVVMNMKPNGLGGTTYQNENRIAMGKKILYTSDGTSTLYQLPYTNVSNVSAKVNTYDPVTQKYTWVDRTDITVDGTNGTVTFATAPAQEDPENPNNVEIYCETWAASYTASRTDLLSATCLSVYGGNTDLAVVVGGCPGQPNAYYWSGNTHLSVDPTYFPTDYYNLAGTDAKNAITAFGRQQGLLIILQKHSIGKTSFGDATVLDRTYLTLNYTGINSMIGCDLGKSVQLIQNNLVFANTYGGVYVLANTTPADENNVRRISKNVNGNSVRGLLADAQNGAVCSLDDGENYWLVLDGHVYLWAYALRGYTAYEENLSWFYFENIYARGFFNIGSADWGYFDKNAFSVRLTPKIYNDFGQPIERRYTFATQYFGTYETYKDVLKLVFAVRSDTRSFLRIHYSTDWEERDDRTPISAAPDGAITLVPYDLTDGYELGSTKGLAYPTVRIPRCFHVHHFGFTIYNNDLNTDMGLVSVQIFYRHVREIR